MEYISYTEQNMKHAFYVRAAHKKRIAIITCSLSLFLIISDAYIYALAYNYGFTMQALMGFRLDMLCRNVVFCCSMCSVKSKNGTKAGTASLNFLLVTHLPTGVTLV